MVVWHPNENGYSCWDFVTQNTPFISMGDNLISLYNGNVGNIYAYVK